MPEPLGTTGKLEPEFVPAYQNWRRQPDPHTRSELLKAVSPVLDAAVRSYGGSGGPIVKSRARAMALKAFDNYSPQRGTLRTHLLSQLQGLQRVAAKSSQILSTPERVLLDRQMLHNSETELADQLGRDPSTSELADFTGLSAKRIAYVRQGRPSMAESTLNDGTNPEAYDPAVSMPGRDPAYQAWVEYVYNDATPVNQAIMEGLLGLRGKRVQSVNAIAKSLGLTPGAISQRAAKIQTTLDRYYTKGAF